MQPKNSDRIRNVMLNAFPQSASVSHYPLIDCEILCTIMAIIRHNAIMIQFVSSVDSSCIRYSYYLGESVSENIEKILQQDSFNHS